MMRTVTVDLGGGLLTIEVDDPTYSALIAAAIATHAQRREEYLRRTGWGGHSTSYTYFDEPFAYRPQHGAPASTATDDRPRHPVTVNDALGVLRHFIGGDTQMFSTADTLRKHVRKAKRITHPDTGGTAADFQLVTAAEGILRTAGRL